MEGIAKTVSASNSISLHDAHARSAYQFADYGSAAVMCGRTGISGTIRFNIRPFCGEPLTSPCEDGVSGRLLSDGTS